MDSKDIETMLDLLFQLSSYYEQPCYYDNTPSRIQTTDKQNLWRMVALLESMRSD